MTEEVVKIPDSILRQKSEIIKEISPEVEELAKQMVDFMDNHSKDDDKPIGLSAIQLGHPVRMIAFRHNPLLINRDDIVILINPELVYTKKQYIVTEGCLSLPGRRYQVKRHKLVKIRGTTLDNTYRSFRGRDLLAQVFQHELNHLDGVLLDRIGKPVER